MLYKKASSRAALITSALLTLAALSGHSAEGWLVDFEKAKKQAAAEGKSILMEFTGSDWCPPCKALASNVLNKDIFKSEVPKNFVLLKLDNPNDKSQQTPEEIEQYKRLSEEYKISGVPTIFLANAQGKPYWQTVGYSGESAEDYVARLTNKSVGYKKQLTAFKKAESASGVEKAKFLDEGLTAMGDEVDAAVNKDQIAEIIKLDSDNSAGLKAKYEGILRSSELTEKFQSVMQSATSAKDALEKITAFIDNEKPAGPLLQEALFYKGAIMFESEDKVAAKEALIASQKVDPKSEIAQRIEQILGQFFKE